MRFRFRFLLAVAACSLFISSAFAASISPFVVRSGGNNRNDVYPQAGFGFAADASGTAQINQLGYYDEGGDGLQVAHEVGLYHYTGVFTLIAKATIPAGTAATLQDGYRWVSIPTVTLTDGTQGGDYYELIASQGPDIWWDGGGTTIVNPFGNFPAGPPGDGFNVGLPMPAVGGTSPLGLGGPSFGGPNMGFVVPEPSSLVLLVLGAAFVAWSRSRRGLAVK
jgi:hypothetical protein